MINIIKKVLSHKIRLQKREERNNSKNRIEIYLETYKDTDECFVYVNIQIISLFFIPKRNCRRVSFNCYNAELK